MRRSWWFILCTTVGGVAVAASLSIPAGASFTAHAKGRVVGISSGGGSKACVVATQPDVPGTGSGVIIKLIATCPLSNIQSSGFTTRSTWPTNGSISLDLTSSGNVSCQSLATKAPTWSGTVSLVIAAGQRRHEIAFTTTFKPDASTLYGSFTGTAPSNSLELTKLAGIASLQFKGGSCASTTGVTPPLSFEALLALT
jgi:hypothetical protein